MDKVISGDDLHDAARLARECAVLERAVTLARSMGTGKRPVTSAQVLRKADVSAAGAAIGVRVPPNTRTAADVPELHGPWSAAIATGLLRISDGLVTSGPALEGWPPGDAALLDAWFAGLRAVCQALADPRQEDGFTGMLVCALALLTVLEDEGVPAGKELWHAVLEESDDLCDTYDLDLVPAAAMRRAGLAGQSRLGGMVALLAGFGAVTGYADRPVITAARARWPVAACAWLC